MQWLKMKVKLFLHLSVAALAQVLGLVVASEVLDLAKGGNGLAPFVQSESWVLMGLVSLGGFVVVGLPSLFFLSLSGFHLRPFIMTIVGAFGGLAFLAIFVFQDENFRLPPWELTLFAMVHGGVTGLSFALLARLLGREEDKG